MHLYFCDTINDAIYNERHAQGTMKRLEPYEWYYCDTKENECKKSVKSTPENVLMTINDCKSVCKAHSPEAESAYYDAMKDAVAKIKGFTADDNGKKHFTLAYESIHDGRKCVMHGYIIEHNARIVFHLDDCVSFDVNIKPKSVNVYLDSFFNSDPFLTSKENPVTVHDYMDVMDCLCLGCVTTQTHIMYEVLDAHRLLRDLDGTTIEIDSAIWLFLLRGYTYYEGRGFIRYYHEKLNYDVINKKLQTKLVDVFGTSSTRPKDRPPTDMTIADFVQHLFARDFNAKLFKTTLKSLSTDIPLYTFRLLQAKVADLFHAVQKSSPYLNKRINVEGNVKLFMKFTSVSVSPLV
jgi:hypothetical protein